MRICSSFELWCEFLLHSSCVVVDFLLFFFFFHQSRNERPARHPHQGPTSDPLIHGTYVHVHGTYVHGTHVHGTHVHGTHVHIHVHARPMSTH
jgi:hypothetical protein